MKLKLVIAVILAIVFLPLISLYWGPREPVLYRYVDTATVEHDAVIIQNPFRDRVPEKAIDKFFQRLGNGDCMEAMSLRDLDNERTNYLCERETRYPIQTWSIMDRIDDGDHIHFYYDVTRSFNNETFPDVSVEIDVELSDSAWQITRYDATY